MDYITRALETPFTKFAKTFPVLLLTGARQVGKTTMLKHLAKNERTTREFVTLDNLQDRALALEDPALFFERYQPPILIDEIQYAPQLLETIKLLVDEHAGDKTWAGAFWLTGSQPFHVMQGVSQSLAGRVCILELDPLTLSEKRARATTPFSPSKAYFTSRTKEAPALSAEEVFTQIWRGGYPGICHLEDAERNRAFEDYIATYLMRDIRDLKQVDNEVQFRKFLGVCANFSGRPLNYDELARIAGISPKTAQSWMSLLVGSHMVRLLEPFSANHIARLSKRPILHFCDTGLAAYLAGWLSKEALSLGAFSGPILETFTYNQIRASYTNSGQDVRLSHLRANNNQEIDLVLERDHKLFPVEVKQAGVARQTDGRAFSLLASKNYALGTGTIACLSAKSMPITRDVWQMPISSI